MRSRRPCLCTIVLLGIVSLPGVGEAQELVARAYANTPVGVNFIGVGYGQGGTTRVDGSVRQTLQRNWRFGVFLAYPFAPNQGVMVSVMSGVTRRVGADFDSIAVAYQYSWRGL